MLDRLRPWAVLAEEGTRSAYMRICASRGVAMDTMPASEAELDGLLDRMVDRATL
jgi:hypothetical protein